MNVNMVFLPDKRPDDESLRLDYESSLGDAAHQGMNDRMTECSKTAGEM